jgi:hypothetical protein
MFDDHSLRHGALAVYFLLSEAEKTTAQSSPRLMSNHREVQRLRGIYPRTKV